MTINAGYDTVVEFELYTEDQLPVSATFEADVKQYPLINGDDTVLATLTTAGGQITVVSSEANTNLEFSEPFVAVVSLTFEGDVTGNWSQDEVATDLVRTDVSPIDYMGFIAIIPVNHTITRVTP